jgi:hypothetical protein
MKSNFLKILCTVIMSLAICSLKAQSLQQRQQKDMELRQKQVNEVRLKAKEQQVQQKAERTNEVNVPQQASTGTSTTVPSNSQTIPVPQQKKETNIQLKPVTRKQKQLTTQ